MSDEDKFDYSELDPGIREVVRWLRDAGFKTTDSGDGVTKLAQGWPEDEVMAFPHVNIESSLAYMLKETNELIRMLYEKRIQIEPIGGDGVSIQVTYDPADGSASILLLGLNDDRFLVAQLERDG